MRAIEATFLSGGTNFSFLDWKEGGAQVGTAASLCKNANFVWTVRGIQE
jgi:hypothetical protein